MDLLPTELIVEIIRWSIRSPNGYDINVLSVCRRWLDIALTILHADLYFSSLRQIQLFLDRVHLLCGRQRSITIALAGASVQPKDQLFQCIACLFQRCGPELPRVTLRLNSHSLDPHAHLIGDALAIISPLQFRWLGPDPPHHFSTAIVPRAAEQLTAISCWTALQSLELSNIAFSKDQIDAPLVQALVLFPHKHLVHIRFSQAVFLSAEVVVQIAIGVPSLKLFELVDAYVDSIWGRRLRLATVEQAARGRHQLDRVQMIVRCQAKLQRIMGGDRGSDSHSLYE